MGITPAELAAVRYIGYDYWVELSGGTRLPGDAAARIRAGVTVFGVSSDRPLSMARAVADGARFPAANPSHDRILRRPGGAGRSSSPDGLHAVPRPR